MEKHPPLPMTQLDMLVTTQELQIMKLMLPYIPSSYRGMLAIYLKFAEFQNTIRLFNASKGAPSQDIIKSRDIHSPADILEDLRPFMNPGDMDSFDMMMNMMNTMNMMKGMNTADFSNFENSEEMSDMMNIFDNIMKGNKENE